MNQFNEKSIENTNKHRLPILPLSKTTLLTDPFMASNNENIAKKKDPVSKKWLSAPPPDPTPRKSSPKKK